MKIVWGYQFAVYGIKSAQSHDHVETVVRVGGENKLQLGTSLPISIEIGQYSYQKLLNKNTYSRKARKTVK